MMWKKYQPLWLGLFGLVALPLVFLQLGLTLDSATLVVILAMAAMGLNLLVGYTGLVSFGHSAWFGLGGYAAALAQLYWFPGQVLAPMLVSVLFTAMVSVVVGYLILRRRGVYFALLTLALCALTFAVAFRWTSVTGGEGGLGGLTRGVLGPFDLEGYLDYYVFTAVVALLTLYLLLRVVRSPFGRVLVAIRENQQRATFQGYTTDYYKLVAFVLSACVTGLAGSLLVFLHHLAAAESTTVSFSGELLAMVVIGGMHSLLGPALGALFYQLFRELFSIYTDNWLFWFGLVFLGFVLFSPSGLTGIWARMRQMIRPLPTDGAAMSKRRIHEGLPLPRFLRPAAGEGDVLQVRDLNVRFGGIHAVRDVNLTVRAGEIHALIGPNGAGKTSTFNLISGMFMPTSGRILLHDREIQHARAEAICRMGLTRSFQITNLFKGLTIHENLRLSLQACRPGRFNLWRDADDDTRIQTETAELMRFLGLEGMEQVRGEQLSYGGQRLVDLGIALGSKPKLLLLDEPLAGLAAAERERVSRLIQTIAANVPVLIVEHDIDRVLAISDQVTVMNQGEVLITGGPQAIRESHEVQQIYTGTGTPPVTGRVRAADAPPRTLLQFSQVDAYYGKSHILQQASLEVREGEIVALLGRNGAGKSTLLKTVVGLVRAASGTVEFSGQGIADMAAPDIARMGIGYVPQGRGLFAGMTVAENLALGRQARPTDGRSGVVWDEATIFEYFPRIQERMEVEADYLSGGEQQMVAVARALSGNVRLLLLDEPFEGLAPAVVQELFTVFDRLRQHLSIVIVEHNLDLVLALADRVYALERGAVFHEGPAQALLTDLDYRKQILWL